MIDTMHCPSRPIPPFYPVGGFQVGMPSYVGISAATNGDGFVEDRTRVYPKTGGEISAAGLLVTNATIRRRKVEDGTFHTFLVGKTIPTIPLPSGSSFC